MLAASGSSSCLLISIRQDVFVASAEDFKTFICQKETLAYSHFFLSIISLQ